MAGENIKVATDENFEKLVIQSEVPSLVDFWAVWCGPCRALAPIIDELASENSGILNVFKLNVDDNPNTAAQYGVRGIPTVLLFKGGQVIDRSVGVVPKDKLKALITRAVS